jgi:protein TonB
VIEKNGKITDIKVIRDIGFGTGAEAIRVLSKYEYWLPGKQRGVPVRVMYSLPLTIQSNF